MRKVATPRQKRLAMMLANNTGGVGRQSLLDGAPFLAELTHTAVPVRAASGTAPTFTRATTATVRNNDGYLVTAVSGEARFVGARRVRNLIAGSSEDITNLSWNSTASARTATTVAFVGGGGQLYNSVTNATPPIGTKFVAKVLLSGTPGNTINLYAMNGAANSGAGVQITLTATPTVYSVAGTVSVVSQHYLWIMPASFLAVPVATGSQTLTATKFQLEDVTAQTTQTAGEYVSVGVLSTPYHGSMVDGVKCFPTDISGNPIPAATNTGYLAEGAGTQLLATADIRDMTTVGWTLGATMTRARTSVGADGAANSATRLTGGAVAATNTCYTTIVAAASSRTYSALVKRVTGTGPVRIVQTGTETDISTQLNATGFALVQLNASVLNAAMGFKIDTNGDAIDVDFNQFEARAFATSRMAATGAARNADVLTYPSAGNAITAQGSMFCQVAFSDIAGAYSAMAISDGTATNAVEIDNAGNATTYLVRSTGTQATINPASIITKLVSANTAAAWNTNYAQAATNGTLGTQDNLVAVPAAFTTINVGDREQSNPLPLYGTIKNVRIFQRALSSSEMQAITA